MVKIPFNTLILGLILLFAQFNACSGPALKNVPDWTTQPMVDKGQFFSVVGVSYPHNSERAARDDALFDALKHILRYTGMSVNQYAQMVAVESGRDFDISTDTNNTEVTRIATDGFVQRIKHADWHIEDTSSDQFVAYVEVSVPAEVVSRIESHQKTLQEARQRPLRDANDTLRRAILSHDLDRAVKAIPEIIDAYRLSAGQSRAPEPSRSRLLARIFKGLEFRNDSLLYDLDAPDESLTIRVVHQGAPVAGLACQIRLPSGNAVQATTDRNGQLSFVIPQPAHPGIYTLALSPALPGTEAHPFEQNVLLSVVGDNESLAKGVFHDYLEVLGIGSASADRYKDRRQAEFMALKTAKHLAHAALLEERDGLQINSRTEYRDRSVAHETITSQAHGRVNAEIVHQQVYWKDNGPEAEVVLRLPL